MEGIILNADSLTALRAMPDSCVDMCMTSPPYWQQRDYGVAGQLGLEPTPQEYVSKLCDVFDEMKRVLKPTGTCWVNLGDTYSGMKIGNTNGQSAWGVRQKVGVNTRSFVKPTTNIRDKCLMQIPSRFAIEMIDRRGWILRNEIIWHKPNCMPQSAMDRFTVDFEKLFFFTKSTDYFFEQQFEPLAASSVERAKYGWNCERANNEKGVHVGRMEGRFCNSKGRNMRSVWSIGTNRFKGAHFATYPERLCEPPIKAGCPEFICNACGKPRQVIREKIRNISQAERNERKRKKKCRDLLHEVNTVAGGDLIEEYRVVGWSDCGCNRGFRSGIVLDPFAGTGTTLVVAKRLGRKFVGIELNPEYCRMAEERLNAAGTDSEKRASDDEAGRQALAA